MPPKGRARRPIANVAKAAIVSRSGIEAWEEDLVEDEGRGRSVNEEVVTIRSSSQ
jgi:hypothetical protein